VEEELEGGRRLGSVNFENDFERLRAIREKSKRREEERRRRRRSKEGALRLFLVGRKDLLLAESERRCRTVL